MHGRLNPWFTRDDPPSDRHVEAVNAALTLATSVDCCGHAWPKTKSISRI